MSSLGDSISNFMLDGSTDMENALKNATFDEIFESYQIISDEESWNGIMANYFYNEVYNRASSATFNANIYYKDLNEWLDNPVAHAQVGFSDKYLILDNNTVPVYRNTDKYYDEVTNTSFEDSDLKNDHKYPIVNIFLKNPSIVVKISNDNMKIIKLIDEKEEVSFSTLSHKHDMNDMNEEMIVPLKIIYLDDYELMRNIINNLSDYLTDLYSMNVDLVNPEDDMEEI